MPPPADALLGRVIAAKYRIEAFLGGGAMGAVYRARHIALERDVAIKVIRTALATDRSFVARFHREALSMSRMTHAHLIHVSDFGEEPDGLLYLVMEYVAGHTLEHVIKEQAPLPKERVVHIISQVLSAVAVAHDAGVIHRDLKPDNILLLDGLDDEGNPSESVKVCDFGIASMMGAHGDDAGPSVPPPPGKPDLRDIENTAPLPESLVGHLTQAGALVGTPAYMSPEQVQGFTLDARTDLYALGVVMYEMLTGSAPFPAETLEQILAAHVGEVPRSPDRIANCDRGLATITMRALAKNPRDRFASARAMRAEVRATLMSLPIGSPSRARMRATHPSTPAPPWAGGSAPFAPTEPGRRLVAQENLETLAQAGSVSKPGSASEAPSTRSPAKRAYRRFGLMMGGVLTVLGATAAVWFGARATSTKGQRDPSVVALGTTPLAAVAPTASTHVEGMPAPSAQPAAPPSAPTPLDVADKSYGASDKTRPPSSTSSAFAQGTLIPREAPLPNNTATSPASSEPAAPPPPVAPPSPVASTTPVPSTSASTPASTPTAQDAPTPAAAPFSPAAARVSASIANVQRTNRAAVAGLISHVDFTPCYRDVLRSLGRAEGGQGSLHLEIDEDGIIHAARATLPGALTGASTCVAGKVRGQRVTPPDTGSASADVALVFTPQ